VCEDIADGSQVIQFAQILLHLSQGLQVQIQLFVVAGLKELERIPETFAENAKLMKLLGRRLSSECPIGDSYEFSGVFRKNKVWHLSGLRRLPASSRVRPEF